MPAAALFSHSNLFLSRAIGWYNLHTPTHGKELQLKVRSSHPVIISHHEAGTSGFSAWLTHTPHRDSSNDTFTASFLKQVHAFLTQTCQPAWQPNRMYAGSQGLAFTTDTCPVLLCCEHVPALYQHGKVRPANNQSHLLVWLVVQFYDNGGCSWPTC